MPKVIPANATLRQQRTCCGRKKCGTCKGIVASHGPYWFAYWEEVTSSRRRGPSRRSHTRSMYVGRELPDTIRGDRTVTTIDGRRVTAAFARAADDDQGEDAARSSPRLRARPAW